MHVHSKMLATATRPTTTHEAAMCAIHTYRQIAEILEAQSGTPITPKRVRQICRAAEMKIVGALVDELFQQECAAKLAEREALPSAASDARALCKFGERKAVLALFAHAPIRTRTELGSARAHRTHWRRSGADA